MAEQDFEQLLKYSEPEEPVDFVVNVMQGVRREQRTRRLILWAFGLVGAIFGLIGAIMLSAPLASVFNASAQLPAREAMQAVLFIAGAAAFYTWFMNDDLHLDG